MKPETKDISNFREILEGILKKLISQGSLVVMPHQIKTNRKIKILLSRVPIF
jgi:aromatic ring-opening dioxygenase LigB subunit